MRRSAGARHAAPAWQRQHRVPPPDSGIPGFAMAQGPWRRDSNVQSQAFNFGGRTRLDFTVLGTAVNEAARIAALCRSLEQTLIISDIILAAIERSLPTRGVSRRRVDSLPL